MKWNDEDVKLVEKFIDIKNRGFYCDGTQLTTVYNRVLEKNVAPTSCGSCIRQRINELESALNQFKRQIELEEKKRKEEENVNSEQPSGKLKSKTRKKSEPKAT